MRSRARHPCARRGQSRRALPAHDTRDSRSYQSGFHWGTGSALTTAAVLHRRYGDLFIHAGRRHAVGLDGVVVDEAAFEPGRIALAVTTLPRRKPYTGIIASLARGCTVTINGTPVSVNTDGKFSWPGAVPGQ